MKFHQKSWRNLFLAESGVTEKGVNGSDSLPSKEEPDFPGHLCGTGAGTAQSSPRGCSHSASQIGSSIAIPILFLPLFPHITHMAGGGQQGGWHWSFTDISTPKELEVPPLWAVLYTLGLEDENTLGLSFPSLHLPRFHQNTIPYPFPWQLPPRRLKLLFGSQQGCTTTQHPRLQDRAYALEKYLRPQRIPLSLCFLGKAQ